MVLAPCASAQAASPAAKETQKPVVAAAPTASAADAELLLRGCAGEAHRNAKLYLARAHGIQLMKRSADRDQGRSMLRIEAQLDGTLTQLRGTDRSVDAELDRMQEALIGLTELTLQQPLVEQVGTALRLAERAAEACGTAIGKLGYDGPGVAAPAQARVRQLAIMSGTSQQLAGNFLMASLKPGGPSAAELALLTRLADGFDAELARLRTAGAADGSLRDTLPLLEGQWLFVRHALARPRENARTKIEDMGRASELLFDLIDTELRRQRRQSSYIASSR